MDTSRKPFSWDDWACVSIGSMTLVNLNYLGLCVLSSVVRVTTVPLSQGKLQGLNENREMLMAQGLPHDL